MTIYYDSSALIKIYVKEDYSDFVRNTISENQYNYISNLSYIEIHSVFSRLAYNTQITKDDLMFACFDKKLADSAISLGIEVLKP